ncbi:MAG: hemolysin III family protein [Turneriella sp.]
MPRRKLRQTAKTNKVRSVPAGKKIPAAENKAALRRRKKLRLSRFKRAMRFEIANLLTHGIGLGLAVAGAAFLIVKGSLMHDAYRVVSYSIFGASMIFLYLASSLYHALWNPQVKKVMRRLDHGAIFFAIAGTYTPILLVTLNGPLGWTFFGIVWGLAVVGIAFKMVFGHRYEAVSLTAYILMGWLVVFIVKPVYVSLSGPGLWMLFAGGISYTAGTIFYAMPRLPFHHMIWHLFVLGGSICHFLCIYMFV